MKRSLKLILVIFIIFITSGCNVEYNLDIKDESMIENIVFSLDNNPTNKERIENLYTQKRGAYYDFDSNSSQYYTVSKGSNKKDNTLFLKYHYEYPETDLKNSNAIGECFYNKSVIKDEKYITLNTSNGLTCMYRDGNLQIENLTINISTKFSVKEHNADTVFGNTYTWNITDKNYNNKSIYMKIDYNNVSKSTINKENITLFFEILSIFLVIIVIIIISTNSSRKTNRKDK